MKATLPLLVAAALAVATPAFAAGAPEHDSHGTARITLDHGRKWATDEPLRQGMSAIHAELSTRLGAIGTRKLDLAQYRALGDKIESQVGFIVANCKLPPEADANLHVVVADLLAAADGLKAARDTKQGREAALRAVKAAETYAAHFEHPQWRSLALAHAHGWTDLPAAVALVEQTFPGRVVAAQSDATGGDALHHHVDLLLPHGAVAQFEVEAGSGRILSRASSEAGSAATLALADAVGKVKQETQGDVVAAEFSPDPTPHYKVNVRTTRGELKRLAVDLETGALRQR